MLQVGADGVVLVGFLGSIGSLVGIYIATGFGGRGAP